jgi:hypothetical protein
VAQTTKKRKWTRAGGEGGVEVDVEQNRVRSRPAGAGAVGSGEGGEGRTTPSRRGLLAPLPACPPQTTNAPSLREAGVGERRRSADREQEEREREEMKRKREAGGKK